MEKVTNTDKNIKPNYRSFKEEESKPFYAAYLNTAIHNIYTVFKDISESLGIAFNFKNDYQILGSDLIKKLEENNEPELSQKIIERLDRQFSFLKTLTLHNAKNRTQADAPLADAIDYHQVIKLWVSQLMDYRNFYSHALHVPIQMDPFIVDGMRSLYDADWKEFKERKTLSTEDTAHLIRLGKNGESRNFHYAFLDKQGNITEKGFLYFTCLWLEKKDAQELLKKHKGFKRGESKSQKATLEKFIWFGTRVPKPRLTSDNSQQGLFMDMVNDLKRCPVVLFDLLSEADKARFYTEDEFGADEEDGYEAKPFLIRKTNRFYYFAMRFLEQRFEHLKFHIDLGNYCYKTYDQVIEGVTRKRRWISRITAFGNLTDFRESDPPLAWREKLLSPGETDKPSTYITPTTAHYHFDPSSKVMAIGLKWVEDYRKDAIWPDIETADVDQKYRNVVPDFWLSLYELPSLVFYQILHEKGLIEHSAESIIKSYREKLNKGFLNNVAEKRILPGLSKVELEKELKQRGLDIQCIPKTVVNYLLSKDPEPIESKAKARLARLKEENTCLLSQVERQEPHYRMKPGSKNHIAPKAGTIADFLAHDMLLLQKPIKQDQGKANSTEFQILQAKLAYFNQNKESLNETFKLCNLTEAPNAHPFLGRIELAKCKGIVDFYKKYLLQRAKFLDQCIMDKSFKEYHFLKIKDTSDTIKALIEKQQNAVLNLPRGLFKSHIQTALTKGDTTSKLLKDVLADNTHNNAFIIQEYFKRVEKDESQTFYEFKRSYELLTKLYDTRRPKDRKPAPPKFFAPEELTEKYRDIKKKLALKIDQKLAGVEKGSPEEARIRSNFSKQYKKLMDDEKQIRLFKTCDMVQFLMVDQLYQQLGLEYKSLVKKDQTGTSFQMGKEYSLREIIPDGQDGILSLKTQVKLPLYLDKGDSTECKIIVRDKMKIKNYGDFRLFLKDRRIKGLLPYIDAEEIAYEALKRELEEFDKCRRAVIAEILRFEQNTVKKFNMELSGKRFFNHEKFLEKGSGYSAEEIESMSLLRNAFFHSIYPSYEQFRGKVNGERFNELKDYTADDPEVDQKSIIQQLKNLTLIYYRGL